MFSRIRRRLSRFIHSKRSSGPKSENPLYANAIYYPNWRIYRQEAPSSLRLESVSHVFYAFAWIREDGSVYLSDEHADDQVSVDGTTGCLRAFVELKQQHPRLRVILSVGGGGKGSDNFALVVQSWPKTEIFVRTARVLLNRYGLDGIDIDWEHPSNPTQGVDYVNFLIRLRQFLPSPRYIVTSCLPADLSVLGNINLVQAAESLDFLNLMAYDFSGPWTAQAGHHAALHSSPTSLVCGQAAVSYVLRQGVPPGKLLLGIPVYGRSFLGCSRPGQCYECTGGEDGVFDYKDLPRPGTKEVVDKTAVAAYCVGGDGGFVSYDTPETVRVKARFVTKERLAGLFYWHGPADASGERSLVETGYRALQER